MEKKQRIFIISTTTPYTVNDIMEFMYLTGCKIDETEKIMANFCKCGVSNLKDVHTIIKLGYYCFKL